MKIGCLTLILLIPALPASAALKVHGIFGSHMVIQRDKPVKIWGWADAGSSVSVSFGHESTTATATDGDGLWQVEFPAREANGMASHSPSAPAANPSSWTTSSSVTCG